MLCLKFVLVLLCGSVFTACSVVTFVVAFVVCSVRMQDKLLSDNYG